MIQLKVCLLSRDELILSNPIGSAPTVSDHRPILNKVEIIHLISFNGRVDLVQDAAKSTLVVVK
jgi:hypothetical protein